MTASWSEVAKDSASNLGPRELGKKCCSGLLPERKGSQDHDDSFGSSTKLNGATEAYRLKQTEIEIPSRSCVHFDHVR